MITDIAQKDVLGICTDVVADLVPHRMEVPYRVWPRSAEVQHSSLCLDDQDKLDHMAGGVDTSQWRSAGLTRVLNPKVLVSLRPQAY